MLLNRKKNKNVNKVFKINVLNNYVNLFCIYLEII